MFKILITTSDNYDILKNIALKCVSDKKISPCVHIVKEGIETLYVWNDSLSDIKEYILMIKCKLENMDKIKKIIDKYHNYDVPEIISIDFDIASKKYKKWFESK